MWEIVQNVWRPALEILILAVGIYYASRFVRGTRGWPVVVGFVVLLAALAVVATLLQLTVLQWILGNASVFIALGAVVIFQPELRRMLGEVGNLPLFASAHEQRENIEIVIQTCERLAEVKIGALIAIERDMGLRDFVETGTRVEARVSAPLIGSIFTPPSPLHDGAVVVVGNQIVAAGCTLPLSDVKYVEGSLGMRHRAGLGIATVTDAIAVIVSETTGKISFASRGGLLSGLTPSQLKYNIQQALAKEL